tara:strand:- start:17 stop:493 length:477 start_codon:yes stop_codon:yes gene_type:complete
MGGDTLMTDQLELFKEAVFIKLGDQNRVCKSCGETKDITFFVVSWYRKDGSKSYETTCRKCRANDAYNVKLLKEKIPYPSDDYCCPICNSSSENLKSKIDGEYKGMNRGSWVLDHDHKSGKFRGWLCNKCNSALGWLDDDITYVRRALNYLENFKNNS